MAPPSDRAAPPPWSGWIETTGDALLILEAARRGLIPRVTRRLVDGEREMIASRSVPSRILGNFLLYRETDKKGAGHSRRRKSGGVGVDGEENEDGGRGGGGGGESLSWPRNKVEPSVNRHRERTLVGSLTNSYKFKADGLMKKVSDVEAGRLRAPSTLPELASLDISPALLDRGNFRCPPKLERIPIPIPIPMAPDLVSKIRFDSFVLALVAPPPLRRRRACICILFFSRLSMSIMALVMLARPRSSLVTRPRWRCPASVYVCRVLGVSARVSGGLCIA
ncbi:hypothetical protein K438DRAFT_1976958 [Mycena galopus ATCC 62051]|nr:hypothetical protein K438DRAFT_1976958 [Mycena galopus ATCC 62051]